MNDPLILTPEEKINRRIAELIAAMEQRETAEDVARVKAAYQLAAEAHKEQRRKSGEPYIIHPIDVALIVARELELGANPVIAALLHDVVEDTPFTIEEIRALFGDDVAFLVGVVTKQKKDKYEQSKQIDNYRQMLASVQYDVRAILIKLADRLHNMRTLDSMRPDKQMKIAGETDYFYAPLANRLGLYHIKSELEKLSFRYRCPRDFANLERLIAEEREALTPNLESFTAKIDEVLRPLDLSIRTEVRYRTPSSIWRKMQSSGCDFHHVTGKHYIRIIYTPHDEATVMLDEKMSSLLIYARLTSVFKERPGSVSNYIDTPKENGYQSFHVKLLSDQGTWEEVHISSERMVRNSRLGCAAERTEDNLSQWLEKFKSVLRDAAFHSHEMDYMDGVTSSFYNDDIMVFTPKGKGLILPKGASALDFAYEIHSEVGRYADHARINGKLVSVKTRLRRGDCVEIGINKESRPDPDWINHVMTYKAKRSLRSFLSSVPKLEYCRCSFCHPLPGDEVIGFRADDGQITIHKRNCQTAIRLASQQGDSIVPVDFKENEPFIYPVRIGIRGVDRFHLLSDLTDCFVSRQHLSMDRLTIDTTDRIVTGTIDFSIHSVSELDAVMEAINAIDGVDEVYRVDIE